MVLRWRCGGMVLMGRWIRVNIVRFYFGDVGIVGDMWVCKIRLVLVSAVLVSVTLLIEALVSEVLVSEVLVSLMLLSEMLVSEVLLGVFLPIPPRYSRRVRPWEPVVQWLALFVFLVFLSFGIVWNIFGNQWSGAGEGKLPEIISPCYFSGFFPPGDEDLYEVGHCSHFKFMWCLLNEPICQRKLFFRTLGIYHVGSTPVWYLKSEHKLSVISQLKHRD